MANGWHDAMVPGKWYPCFGKLLRDVPYVLLNEYVRTPSLPALERKVKGDGVYFRRPKREES